VQFRVLGPVEPVSQDRPVDVPHGRERVLLASLVARVGEVVDHDVLVDDLWGEAPPHGAGTTLRSYVTRLRRVLEEGTATGEVAPAIRSRAGGYQLCSRPDDVDSTWFARLVQQGVQQHQAGTPEAAVATLEQALACWRGRPFPELAHTAVGQQLTSWLDELHLGALEELYAARLELGRTRTSVAELTRLVLEQPLRERLWELLVGSLLAEGRRAEAISACRRADALLRQQLGVGPGPGLLALRDDAMRDADPLRRGRSDGRTDPRGAVGSLVGDRRSRPDRRERERRSGQTRTAP
jgi:DNA-binding SARP family transcriptional activator